MQTDDNRKGIYEGVITCYLAEYLDADEFWQVIDGYIYADHTTVIAYLISITEGSDILAWLSPEKSADLISNCPTYQEAMAQ